MTASEEYQQWLADGQQFTDQFETVEPSVFHWPTDYTGHKNITRGYATRPDIYKGQIPQRLYHPSHWHDGHEGVDIRTGVDGNVYAIAPGTVYQVGWRTPGHAYGYAMRIQHEVKIDGKLQKMRSVYAHLKKDSNRYQVESTVFSQFPIAIAGSTGNSTGDHLHLTLYWWFDSLNSYRIVNPMWVLSL